MDNQNAIEFFEGQNLLYMQIFGNLRPVCLMWACELGIPDIISNHGKPITLLELVSALQIPPSKVGFVKRFMRFLAHNRIFDIHESQEDHHELAYALTPASKLLVNDSIHCLSPMLQFMTDPFLTNAYHHLGEWMRGDDPTLCETAFGTTLWGLLEKKPSYNSLFNQVMTSFFFSFFNTLFVIVIIFFSSRLGCMHIYLSNNHYSF